MENKYILVALLIACLLVGSFAGATLFPKQVEIEKEVLVPAEPVVQTVEVEKIVTVEDTEKIDLLEAQLDELVVRYEQLANERYSSEDVSAELQAIRKAKIDFEDYKYKLLFGSYSLSDVTVEKFYDERVEIKDVKRIVDGKRVDYEQATVRFEVKVAYEDDEGLEYRRHSIKITYDIDADGDEQIEFESWRV